MVPTFSILFISDLHIGGNSRAKVILERLAQKLSEDKTQAVDFLVIAGDIVKYNKGITNDDRIEQYKAADTVIHKLCTTCKIDEQNVVIVPGNHDSDVDLSKQEKKVKFFNEKCIPDNNIPDSEEFKNYYYGQFQQFCDFYHKYCDEDTYFWDKDLLGNNLKDGIGLIQGLKVYDQYKTAFVCINTEWNYDPTEKNGRSAPCLLPRLINKSFEKIRSEYPDYTVITIMHRNPYDLSWSDLYQKDSFAISLYYDSDIIVTGHQHSQLFSAPHRMANRAQLLNLGTVSEIREGIYNYQASLMQVDSFNSKIILTSYVCENSGRSFEWKKRQAEGPETFDITPKWSPYLKCPKNNNLEKFHSGLPIRCFSKGTDDSFIMDAIRKHYKKDYEKYLIGVRAERINEKTADILIPKKETDGPLIIVIYDTFTLGSNDDAKIKNLSSKAKILEERYSDLILSGEIVLQTALMEIPGNPFRQQ